MLRSDLIDLLTQRNPHLPSATVEQGVKTLLEHMSETLAAWADRSSWLRELQRAQACCSTGT
jgi:hypothetical protein